MEGADQPVWSTYGPAAHQQNHSMILIALGANLPSPAGPPRITLITAMTSLTEAGIHIKKRSRLYRSAPLPPSGQPDFVNAMVSVETTLDPDDLLSLLHRVEAQFGRQRRDRWEARTLDLDLIDYHQFVTIAAGPETAEDGVSNRLILPHPRLQERAFVLRPLLDIAPDWHHPTLLVSARGLCDAIGTRQICEPLDEN